MNTTQAREIVLDLLARQGRARNSEMLALLDDDNDLLHAVREDLLQAGLVAVAPDRKSLVLVEDAAALPGEVPTHPGKVKVFISYGRSDAKDLVDRIEKDLREKEGYTVWRDTNEIKASTGWQETIVEDGLRSAQVVVAVMTPHAVRTSRTSVDRLDSVCLGEIAWALYNPPPQPVVPLMASSCEPPLCLFHLDYADMRGWTESDSRYAEGYKRLVEGIQAALRGEMRYRTWWSQLDPWDFGSFLNSKRRYFAGRRWLFDKIDRWRDAHDAERTLLIKGDPGTGKSAIVADLVHRNPDGQVLAYHCCQWDTTGTLEAWRMVRSLAAMIAGRLEEYSDQLALNPQLQLALSEKSCRQSPATALERGILAPLERCHAPENGVRYLLIDALDEALIMPSGPDNIVDLLASRLNRLPSWLRIVATTRNESAVLDRLAGLRALELSAAAPENKEDLHTFLLGQLGGPRHSEAVQQCGMKSAAVAAALLEKSDGNFQYATLALEGIARGDIKPNKLADLPPGLGGIYANRFRLLYPTDESFAHTRLLLDVMVAAREPLTPNEMAVVTGLDPEDDVPRALAGLGGYLVYGRERGGQRTRAFYHKSLGDWLTDPDRKGQPHKASLTKGLQQLTDRGWLEYQTGPATLSYYHLVHLPAQLSAGGRTVELRQLLCDLLYIREKLHRLAPHHQLIEDYSLLAANPPDQPRPVPSVSSFRFAPIEQIAAALHEGERREFASKEQLRSFRPRELDTDWDMLSADFRGATLSQAALLADALAALAEPRYIVPGLSPSDPLSPAEIEFLAARDHAMWVAARLEQGWSYGTTTDSSQRQNPLLVSWCELAEARREAARIEVASCEYRLMQAGLAVRKRR